MSKFTKGVDERRREAFDVRGQAIDPDPIVKREAGVERRDVEKIRRAIFERLVKRPQLTPVELHGDVFYGAGEPGARPRAQRVAFAVKHTS